MAASDTMAAEQKQWCADSGLATLIEAQKIMKDKARYRAAMKLGKEKTAAIAALTEEKGE